MVQAMRLFATSAQMMVRQVLIAWWDLLRQLRIKAQRMELVLCNLGVSEIFIKNDVFAAWSQLRADAIASGEKVRRDASVAQQRERWLKAVESCLGEYGQTILLWCMNIWHDVLDIGRRVALSVQRKLQGMARALQMIMGLESQFLDRCVSAWNAWLREERLRNQLNSTKALLQGARRRVMTTFDRAFFASAHSLVHGALLGWHNCMVQASRNSRRKTLVTHKMCREVLSSKERLCSVVFVLWLILTCFGAEHKASVEKLVGEKEFAVSRLVQEQQVAVTKLVETQKIAIAKLVEEQHVAVEQLAEQRKVLVVDRARIVGVAEHAKDLVLLLRERLLLRLAFIWWFVRSH